MTLNSAHWEIKRFAIYYSKSCKCGRRTRFNRRPWGPSRGSSSRLIFEPAKLLEPIKLANNRPVYAGSPDNRAHCYTRPGNSKFLPHWSPKPSPVLIAPTHLCICVFFLFCCVWYGPFVPEIESGHQLIHVREHMQRKTQRKYADAWTS